MLAGKHLVSNTLALSSKEVNVPNIHFSNSVMMYDGYSPGLFYLSRASIYF
jgi:hypothetical protein